MVFTCAGIVDSSQLTGMMTVLGIAKKGGARVGGKRGVTFKAGLLADREYERYNGPLLSLEQVCMYSLAS